MWCCILLLIRVQFMSDATSVPILLDGDTGYGNFNNARRYEQGYAEGAAASVLRG